MYAWLKVLPAWRRYFAIARRIVISRAVSRAASTSRLKPSFSASPRQTCSNACWNVSRSSSTRSSRAEVVLEPEVVDPDRIAPERAQLVRPLVADAHAHVLEQRQHVREQDRPARADDLEGELVDGRVERDVQAQAEIVRRRQPLDPVDVVDGLTRGEVLAVGAGNASP